MLTLCTHVQPWESWQASSTDIKWRMVLLQGPSDPEKVFDRTSNLENTQIINYRVDAAEKWCVLIGIAPGAPER